MRYTLEERRIILMMYIEAMMRIKYWYSYEKREKLRNKLQPKIDKLEDF